MSSILTSGSTAPAFVSENADGGLNVIGKAEESNFITIEENGAADLGDDVISGGFLGDIIDAGAGDDVIFGGAGDDVLFGGDGSDIIRGGDGMDIIRGGKGSDILIGGEGMDIFDLRAEDFVEGEIDRILGFEDGEMDLLRVTGVSEEVTYDAATGDVKVGDQTVAKIGKDLDVEVTKMDDDTYELF